MHNIIVVIDSVVVMSVFFDDGNLDLQSWHVVALWKSISLTSDIDREKYSIV